MSFDPDDPRHDSDGEFEERVPLSVVLALAAVLLIALVLALKSFVS